ncbi:hypothetical protein ELQ16_07235 [Campylobacter sp. US33a]|nr:hypothetical protein ELQ16_07235 [Campylobacter sp. US33a]
MLLLSLLLANLLKADIIVSPDSLPTTIKAFLEEHFKQVSIGIVQQDKNSYEVYLSDGTELEFDIDGLWKEIESKHKALSFKILPTHIASIITNRYPQAFLIEIERKINHYKIKLSNGLELYIDNNGTIIQERYDD